MKLITDSAKPFCWQKEKFFHLWLLAHTQTHTHTHTITMHTHTCTCTGTCLHRHIYIHSHMHSLFKPPPPPPTPLSLFSLSISSPPLPLYCSLSYLHARTQQHLRQNVSVTMTKANGENIKHHNTDQHHKNIHRTANINTSGEAELSEQGKLHQYTEKLNCEQTKRKGYGIRTAEYKRNQMIKNS